MPSGEVLVAIINNLEDMAIAREAGWYRIPVSSAKRFLKDRWPPRYVAFYQTKVFGTERYAVNYYAEVRSIRIVTRRELFPDMPRNHEKANRAYYQVFLGELKSLPNPIPSRRLRRIVFIPTTMDKFRRAIEINDLWDESPLEDQLWAVLKRVEIHAERQYFIAVEDRNYLLDFAVFCIEGNIDIETDGDTYHIGVEEGQRDRKRNNDLASKGWRVLRFNSVEIKEQPVDYCVSNIMKTINKLGGLDNETRIAVRYNASDPLGPQQLSLFD